MTMSEALGNLRVAAIDVWNAFKNEYFHTTEPMEKVEIQIEEPVDGSDEDLKEDIIEETLVDECLETHYIDFTKTYWYMPEYMGFKTKKGKKILPFIPAEALEMIELHILGRHPKTIYYHMLKNMNGFHHDHVKLSSVQNFLKRYDDGLLDFALRNICKNPDYYVDCPSDYYKYPGNVLAYEEKIEKEEI